MSAANGALTGGVRDPSADRNRRGRASQAAADPRHSDPTLPGLPGARGPEESTGDRLQSDLGQKNILQEHQSLRRPKQTEHPRAPSPGCT
eukprot:7252294-Pyramimonas_sp.AAC.1